MKVIELTNISYTKKNKKIISNVYFEIEKGTMNAIVGKSGTGKTTLLNIIGLIQKQTTGSIKYYGKKIEGNLEKRKILKNKISFIFQNYALVENRSVAYNISMSDYFFKRDNLKIKKALKKVGLNETYSKRKISSLSGGEQQRIAIARAIYRNSEIIIADEPTGNLDDENAINVLKIFKAFTAEGKTVIVVTHDKSKLEIFDKVVSIKEIKR